MSELISMAQLQRLMRDPDVPEAQLAEYFVAVPEASRPFAPTIIPDPARVAVAAPVERAEGAMMMSWANGLSRMRRQAKFKRRRERDPKRPVLVSEGDSWFQFPVFLDDTIDQLADAFDIWSVDAAGDTLQNMVLDDAEYLQALRRNRGEVRALLFSGGGNDLVGEDSQGRPVISQVLRRFEAGQPAHWYVETEAVAQRLRFIERCYREVLEKVAAEFPGLPVLCHGYDYSIPGGFEGDPRRPKWAKVDAWLGRPMRRDLGIEDPVLQQAIVVQMIDRLNARIRGLCGGNQADGAYRNGWYVDARNSVRTLARWADELHPGNAAFVEVANRFRAVLAQALDVPVPVSEARVVPARADTLAPLPLLRGIDKPLAPVSALEGLAGTVSEPRELTPGDAGLDSGTSRSFRLLVVKGRGEPLRLRRASALESIIGPVDERVRILDTEFAPWRMICALRMRGSNGHNVIGTGWFAGPRTIITAGHCVYSEHFFGGWAETIEAIPGRNGVDRPFGSLHSTRFSSVDRWIDQEDPDFDIGCIHLDAPAPPELGWFSVAALPASELERYLVNVAGYPADRGNGAELYHHRNRVLHVSSRRVFYDVDTYGAQSGAPVWLHESENSPPIVIGIHAYGTGASPPGLVANSAPRIIPEVLAQIRTWVQADGGWS